ncbi:MAG TPA: DUF4126 domain-containing protein [Actinomycetota bacterium]|nr:DUF4126 domain-containing protein [Actinomycetota bacterium]
MDAVTGYFTALGLSTAAGLNAYIPLLVVGLFSRYTDLIDLPAPWDHLGDPLLLGIVAAVGVADFVGDKIPIVDHVLHLLGVAVAPVVGGILALAAANALDVDPGFSAVLGVVAALATQVGRTAARPAATATTGGAGNPVVSLGEDGASGTLSVTSVVWPVVAAILAVVVLVAVFLLWRRWRTLGLRLQGRGPAAG